MANDEIKVIINAVLKDEEFKKGVASIKGGLDSLDKKNTATTGKMKAGWLGVVAVIAGASVAIKKMIDFSKEFSEYREGMNTLERNTGQNADKIVASLRKMTHGVISNKDLMLDANRAIAMGVTRDVDTMGKLYEIARVKAIQMGMSTQQAYDMIVQGIGRSAPRVLSSVGFMAQAWDTEAKAKGVSYDKQFMLNKVLQEGSAQIKIAGEYTESTADKTARMTANMENLRLKLGEVFQPLVDLGLDIANALVEAYDSVNLFFIKLGWNMETLQIKIGAFLSAPFMSAKQKAEMQLMIKLRDLALMKFIAGEKEIRALPKAPPIGGQTPDQILAQMKMMEQYYTYIGDLRNADLLKAEEQYNAMVTSSQGNAEQLLAIEQQYQENKALIEDEYAQLKIARDENASIEYGLMYEELSAKQQLEIDKMAKSEGTFEIDRKSVV
jgi:hypothetical protein